jgi:hypothetical protein
MMMVEMLVQMPDLRRRIQRDHVADQNGRCRDCPGTQWPCALHQMATEADRRCPAEADRRSMPPAQRGPHPAPPAGPVRRPRAPLNPALSQVLPPRDDYPMPPAQLRPDRTTPPHAAPTELRMRPIGRGAVSAPAPRVPAPPAAPPVHRVPPRSIPAQLNAYDPGMAGAEPAAAAVLAPRGDHRDRPRHLIGLPRLPADDLLPAPKQELIDVLEDVLRWSR